MPLPKELVPALGWLLSCTGPYYRPALTRIMSTLEDTQLTHLVQALTLVMPST